MKPFDSESFQLKYQMADAAADLYVAGAGQFTMKDIALEVDLEPGDIFNYFPDKKSILQFYYSSHVVRYEFMIDDIENFHSYSIGEKLSNFVYASFDMFSEKKIFVEETFEDLILKCGTKTGFEEEVERLVKQFLEKDPALSLSSSVFLNSCFYSFLTSQYMGLIKFWLNDTSENKQVTMELTDKLTGFVQELLYNSMADKGLDLMKFMYANKQAFLNNIPFVRQLFSKIEIR